MNLISVRLWQRRIDVFFAMMPLVLRAAQPTQTLERSSPEEIFHKADHIKEQRQELERQKRKKKKLQKLEMIEAEEETLWKNVHGHISRKNSKAYDAAIAILNDLFLLAKHRGTQAEYKQGIQSLLKKYPRLSSLKSKITHAKLF